MANQYTTIAKLKEYLFAQRGVTMPTDDALLSRLQDSAADFFDKMVGRSILTHTFTETRDGTGHDIIYPRNYPITAVTSVTINNIAITAAADTVAWGYTFDNNAIYIRAPFSSFYYDAGVPGGTYPLGNVLLGVPVRFTRGRQNVVLSYTAGYATTPSDVEQAIVELVAFKFMERKHVGEKTQSVGGINTTTYIIDDMPMSVKHVINAYQRVTVM